MGHSNLSGKAALVTGASRGIGRAIALALAREGADVAVHYREREREARETADEIAALGRRAATIRADLAEASAASGLAASAANVLGDIHILINNAGITRPRPVEAITEQDWDDVMTVNLKSMFLITQAVLPAMRAARWGRIVNLSSVAAQLGGVVGPHYAASKAGVLGLTHGYATMLAKEGITVNAVAPALVATEMVTSNPRARADLIPVGRFGSPEEVAGAVVMLTLNGYITGQTINVNGGWYMS